MSAYPHSPRRPATAPARYRAAMERAAQAAKMDPLPSVDPITGLQWVIDRLYSRLVHASVEVDQLRPGQLTVMTAYGPTDHEWIRAERQLTDQLAKVCADAAKIGLVDRMISVEEAKAQLMLRAFVAAAVDSGLSHDDLRAIAPKFRENLARLQAPPADGQRRAA